MYRMQFGANGDEVGRLIRALDDKMRRKAVGDAVKAAMKPVIDSAKAGAARDTGALKSAIGSVLRRYRGGSISVGIVGPKTNWKKRGRPGKRVAPIRKPSKYAHLVERGTKSHRIERKGGGSYTHPGSRAQPFMLPAFTRNAHSVRRILVNELLKAVR
jgi:HK97 gp10 family phage protein